VKFVVYNEWQVGVLRDEAVCDVSRLIPEPWRGTIYAMNWLVKHFDGIRADVGRCAGEAAPVGLSSVRLRPPVPVPMQLLAAPANNAAHFEEMRAISGTQTRLKSPRESGFFLKAPGSIVGPSDAIELPPLPGRRFDHEGELALVIGKEARAVPRGRALEYVFGYTCLIDVTLRAGGGRDEERPMRKSYATFTPVGPALVTADEVPDPADLGVRLWVNGDLRQNASMRDLIVGVPELIEIASHVLPLQPGDLYTTGSPSGVGPLAPGDTVVVELDRVGRMSLPVRLREW
jgi:2-keto-4-pentenoate hydratase/2-oxohepta-3-ene-1,7-dioic acid hydratase in catechol pathway